jgi:hypothetical protein
VLRALEAPIRQIAENSGAGHGPQVTGWSVVRNRSAR